MVAVAVVAVAVATAGKSPDYLKKPCFGRVFFHLEISKLVLIGTASGVDDHLYALRLGHAITLGIVNTHTL